MRAVVDGARLEIRLVLHPAGQAGIVHVDQCGNALASALLIGVQPLPAPLAVQLFGNPYERPCDQRAFAVAFDGVRGLGEKGFQLDQITWREVVLMAREVLLQLKDAALGAEQHCLSHGRTLDPARRIADELAQELRLGHQRLGQHVARSEAVHRVGDRNQRQRAELVGDRGEIGSFLRVAAEQDRVTRRKQRIDVVVPRHYVERMLGDDAGRHLQHEAANLLADSDVMRFHPIEDALAGRGVRNELAARQRRAERAALRRMFAFRLEEERMLAPDIATAIRPKSLVDFGDLGGRGDRIPNDPAADPAHHLGDRAVSMDDAGDSRIFHIHVFAHRFPPSETIEGNPRSLQSTARALLRTRQGLIEIDLRDALLHHLLMGSGPLVLRPLSPSADRNSRRACNESPAG